MYACRIILAASILWFSFPSEASPTSCLSYLTFGWVKSDTAPIDEKLLTAVYEKARSDFDGSSIETSEVSFSAVDSAKFESQLGSLLAFLDTYAKPPSGSYWELLHAVGSLRVVHQVDSKKQTVSWQLQDKRFFSLGMKLKVNKVDLGSRVKLYETLWALAEGLTNRRFLQRLWPFRRGLCAAPGAFAWTRLPACSTNESYLDERNWLNPAKFIRNTLVDLQLSEDALTKLYVLIRDREPEATPALAKARTPRFITPTDIAKFAVPAAIGFGADFYLSHSMFQQLIAMIGVSFFKNGCYVGLGAALLTYSPLGNYQVTSQNLTCSQDTIAEKRFKTLGRRLGFHWVTSQFTRALIISALVLGPIASIKFADNVSSVWDEAWSYIEGANSKIRDKGAGYLNDFDNFVTEEVGDEQDELRAKIATLLEQPRLSAQDQTKLDLYRSRLDASIQKHGFQTQK